MHSPPPRDDDFLDDVGFDVGDPDEPDWPHQYSLRDQVPGMHRPAALSIAGPGPAHRDVSDPGKAHGT